VGWYNRQVKHSLHTNHPHPHPTPTPTPYTHSLTHTPPTLITICVDSLKATIKTARPDLLADENVDGLLRIPDHPPHSVLAKHTMPRIEGIGEPATATYFTGANMNPSKWYVLRVLCVVL